MPAVSLRPLSKHDTHADTRPTSSLACRGEMSIVPAGHHSAACFFSGSVYKYSVCFTLSSLEVITTTSSGSAPLIE